MKRVTGFPDRFVALTFRKVCLKTVTYLIGTAATNVVPDCFVSMSLSLNLGGCSKKRKSGKENVKAK